MGLRSDWKGLMPRTRTEEEQRAGRLFGELETYTHAAGKQLPQILAPPTDRALEDRLLDMRRFGSFIKRSSEGLLEILNSSHKRPEDGSEWVPPAERPADYNPNPHWRLVKELADALYWNVRVREKEGLAVYTAHYAALDVARSYGWAPKEEDRDGE